MPRMIDLGSVKLTLLLDCTHEVDGNDVFAPAKRTDWGVGYTFNARGMIPIQSSALLIAEGSTYTLVDTGWGEHTPWGAGLAPDRPESVLKSLAAVCVQPKQISRVIITHTHADHFYGNTLQRERRWIPAFPLAEYVVQAQDAEALRNTPDESWSTQFHPIAERGHLREIHGRVVLSDTLTCWPTPGHTIGHQSVLIHTLQQSAIYLGDLAVLAKNMERLEWGHSWAWSLDADKQSRREVAEWAISHNALLIIGHELDKPVVRLERAGEGYRAITV
jgi:glyoxylase-like metal-dependent hydrolase (beta-lactamase superfamily II)